MVKSNQKRRRAKMKYEIYDQETGKRIGNTVKTTRAAARMVTLIHKKTGRYPDYRPVKENPRLSQCPHCCDGEFIAGIGNG